VARAGQPRRLVAAQRNRDDGTVIRLRKKIIRAVMFAAFTLGLMAAPKPSPVMRRRLFCRRVLLNTLASVGLGAGSAQAQSSFKMSKLTAGYTMRDQQASEICGHCLYFIVPEECMIVEGKVSPYGWCTYYYD